MPYLYLTSLTLAHVGGVMTPQARRHTSLHTNHTLISPDKATLRGKWIFMFDNVVVIMGAGACFLPLSTAHVLMIDKTASDDKKFTWVELWALLPAPLRYAGLQRLTQNIVCNLSPRSYKESLLST